jgi:acyl-CoA thioesterase
MKLGRKHLNGLGCVHGGAIFSLADFAFAMAINSHGNMALAIQCSVTYLRPATEGSLWAEAREVSRTSKLGTYEVEVKNDAGELVARLQGLGYIKKEPVPLRVPRSFKKRRRIEARSAPRANPS